MAKKAKFSPYVTWPKKQKTIQPAIENGLRPFEVLITSMDRHINWATYVSMNQFKR